MSQGDPRMASNHQRLEKARKEPSLGTSRGAWPCRHFDFGLLAFRTERINYFKPPGLWSFVTTALQNQYTWLL